MKLTSRRFYHAFIQVWWKRARDNSKSNKFNVLRVGCCSPVIVWWVEFGINLLLYVRSPLFCNLQKSDWYHSKTHTRFLGCNASHQMRAWARKAKRTFSKYTTNTEFCKWKIEKIFIFFRFDARREKLHEKGFERVCDCTEEEEEPQKCLLSRLWNLAFDR